MSADDFAATAAVSALPGETPSLAQGQGAPGPKDAIAEPAPQAEPEPESEFERRVQAINDAKEAALAKARGVSSVVGALGLSVASAPLSSHRLLLFIVSADGRSREW
jgi:hypothetical protein